MMVRGYIKSPQPKDMIYAPIELAITIAEGLAKRGHKVDFYGPLGTRMKANVKTLGLDPLVNNQKQFEKMLSQRELHSHYVPSSWDNYLAIDMFRQALKGKYDLLYFVHPEVALPFARLFPQIPVAYTLHDPIYGWYRNIFAMYRTPSQYFITISNNQRKAAPEINYAATVYNGIDPQKFTFSPEHDDYLLFVGRIAPEKGVKEAIEVARKTKHKLLIIGPTYPDKIDYFNKHIKPNLNDEIKYLDYIERDKLMKYYQRAKALLTPISWEEPFGMTFLEAMACGTPIVAFKKGSAPEVIVDGKTGYIVRNTGQMARAIKKLDRINREDCRMHVEQNFSAEEMVLGYEAVFKGIIRSQNKLSKRFIKRQLIKLPEEVGETVRRLNLPAKKL